MARSVRVEGGACERKVTPSLRGRSCQPGPREIDLIFFPESQEREREREYFAPYGSDS